MIVIKESDDKEFDPMNIEDEASEDENSELINVEKNKPLEKRVASKIWKIRLVAYNEFLDILKEINDPDDAQECLKNFAVVKFLEDPFPLSLEAALDVLIYIYKYFRLLIKDDTSKEIFRLVIEKAFACSKTPVKMKSKEIITVILETSNDIYIYFEVLKKFLIFSAKKSKSVLFGEQILLFLITEYGCEEFDYKYFIPLVIKLIEGGNHVVRHEAYEIVKEIYKRVRSEILVHLESIKDSYMKELKKEFDKIDENEPNKPKANRTLIQAEIDTQTDNKINEGRSHSHSHKKQQIPFEINPVQLKFNENKDSPKHINSIQIQIEEVKTFEINKEEYFTTPVSSIRNSRINDQKNIIFLSDIYTEDWVNKIMSKERKWMEKRDLLEEFYKNLNNNKIGDFVDVKLDYLFSCFKTLLKDSNINVVLCTLSAINSLSQQLGQSFSIYIKDYLPLIFEKFKEKKDKLNKEIVVSLTLFLKCNINLDDIIPLLSNLPNDKSNQFKLNIIEFLQLSMRKTYKNVLKKINKDLLEILLKLSDEQNKDIRDTAINCIALLKARLNDVYNKEDLFKEVNDNKRMKIDELAKGINYDKLYDVEQIVEKSETPKIKINRKSSITQSNQFPTNTFLPDQINNPFENRQKEINEKSDEYNLIKSNNKNFLSNAPINPIQTTSPRNSIKFSTNNENENFVKLKSKDSTQSGSRIINADDIPLYASTRIIMNQDNPDFHDENFLMKNRQNDLDEFERKLEEAIREENEKKAEGNSSSQVRTVLKKAVVVSRKAADDDDDDLKLNKDEIEDRINSFLGDESAILLQSSKWDEKKNGLIKLNEWITENLEKNFNLVHSNLENLVVFLKQKLKDFKEANFNIIREAVNCYITLIKNFSGKGFDKKFSINIIKGLSEKIGDPKLKENISNLIFEMMENQGPKFILTNIIKTTTNEKKPAGNSSLKEFSILFEKAVEDFSINFIPVKEMVEFCKLLANNTNPQVRNSSTSLLCVLYKYVGKELKVLLKDIKESTLKIIETELEKITVETSVPAPRRELKPNALKEEGMPVTSKGKGSGSGTVANPTSSIMDSLIPRVDISKKITPKLLKDINDGKWPEKKEAGETLEKILNEANMKILPSGLNDLFSTIKGRLSDGNKNVVRLVVNLLGKLIEAVGVGFKTYTKMISGPLINNLSDKMQMLREDVLVCIDKWVSQCGLDTIILYIPGFLKQENFEMRTELFKFLHKYKENFIFIKDKFDLKEFVSPLLLCLQDKCNSVRVSAEELISYSLKFVSLNNYMNELKHFKTAIANTLKQILEKYRGVVNNFDELDAPTTTNNSIILSKNMDKKINQNISMNSSIIINTIASINDKTTTPLKSNNSDNFSKADSQRKIKIESNSKKEKKTPEKRSKYDSKKNEDELSSNSVTIKSNSTIINSNKNITTLKDGKSAKSVATKKLNNFMNSVFISNPSIKTTKDKRLEVDKKYKFNLETLNEDFITKLKDMLKLLFSTEFLTKMFHDEIKFNIEAMNLLQNQIKEAENSIHLNFNLYDYLDLILKWLGWKCNNNQNPSLVKSMLDLLESLCERIELKDIILNDTEGYIIIALLIDKLGVSNSKIKEISKNLIDRWLDKIPGRFGYLVNISAGKNSKVKVDCIEICSSLISNSGASVCSNKDLKFLAKLLSTNDNNLKNALINLFAQVYMQIQENLWTILNDIPDKLKEMLYNNFYTAGVIKDEEEEVVDENQYVNEEAEDDSVPIVIENIRQKENVITQQNSRDKIPIGNRQTEADLNKANSSLTIKIYDQQNPRKKSLYSDDNLINLQNEKNNFHDKENMNSNNSNFVNFTSMNITDRDSLIHILNNLNYGEISERVNVIVIIHELVCVNFDQSKSILVPNIDSIIKAFVISLKNLFEKKNLNEIPIKLGKYLLTVLHKISSNKELIKNISYDILYELSEEVLSNLLIENLEKVGENQEGVVIVRSLNSTMLRVLENCNFTHVISVLLELVKKYRKSQVRVKISNLAIKCLLKINQILSQIIDVILVDKVLIKIHELLVDFEESNIDLNPTNQVDQTVIRYIKNLINELVKLRKESIISDYTRGVEKHPKKDNNLKKWIKNILSTLPGIKNNQSNSNLSNASNEEKISISPLSPSSYLKESVTQLNNLLPNKNKNKQNKAFKSALNETARDRQTTQISHTSNSPSKKPKNSDMYNKIMNLKSKLANFNNNSISTTYRANEENKAVNKTFIDNSITSDYFNSTYIQDNSNKPILSKINELKKKWNDVYTKNKNMTNFSVSPDNNKSKINASDNLDTMNNRISDIKYKYNLTKIKNVNLNHGGRK